MRAIMDFTVFPIGTGNSISSYIAACERVLTYAGLDPHLHAFGTEVEGEWEALMVAVRRCHEAVHRTGAPRVLTYLKLETRNNDEANLSQPVDSVRRKLT